MSVTFVRQCESTDVRKNRGFVDKLIDLAVDGLDIALETPENVHVPFSLLLRPPTLPTDLMAGNPSCLDVSRVSENGLRLSVG